MKAHTFVHDHYSLGAGESPTGHAAAILGGLVMIVAGLGLVLYGLALLRLRPRASLRTLASLPERT